MVKDNVYINGISVIAPGLSDPDVNRAILRGEQQWQAEPLPKLQPAMLPANERRRTTPVIKIALQAMQNLLQENETIDDVATVFASSDGDMGIVDKICQALSTPEKMVSPTQFHNSVHNAPAGYWAIASSLQGPSVSLSAGDATFAAGLLDAYSQVVSERREVLLVAYDVVAPQPLDAARHFEQSFAVALHLSLSAKNAESCSVELSLGSGQSLTTCTNSSLAELQVGNPNAFCLPLLEAFVRNETSQVVLPYVMEQRLVVGVNAT